MALLRAAPIETSNSEGATISGASYVSSPVRAGHGFSVRTNPSGTQQTYAVRSYGTGGELANFARTDPTYVFTWIRVAARPSVDHVRIGQFGDCRLQMDANGDIFLSNPAETSDSAKVATSLDTWTPLWILTDTSGTCALKVGTAAAVTVTGGGTTFAEALLGNSENATFDIYWSDLCVFDDAADGYTNALEMNVLNLTPNGAGASTDWTTGTGTTFAEVDEKPHDNTTTQIGTSTDNAVHLFAVVDPVDLGIPAAIRGLEGWVVIKANSGTANRTIIVRDSAGVNSESGEVTIGATYVWAGRVLALNPATAAAWTLTEAAAAQVGCALRTGLSNLRATAMGILVAYANVAVTSDVTSSASISTTNTANVTSTAAIASSTNVATSAAISCTVVANVTTGGAIGAVGIQSVTTDASVSTDPAVVTESIVRKAKFGGGWLR